jgi:K+-sensing histidine kinase KdpD
MLDDADIAAARWAWENDRAAGRGADTLPGAKRLYLPLQDRSHAGRRRRPRQRQAGAAAHARSSGGCSMR